MKEITLTQGKVALVDDEDYDYLNQYNWYTFKNNEGNTLRFYAVRTDVKIRRLIWMHRLIMNTPKGVQVDHKDHNGLNNQKTNLRHCNSKQNGYNKRSFGKSKYKGVNFYYGKNGKQYIRAAIRINGVCTHIGQFKTEEDAARAYDKKAIELHGEFVNLNIKQNE